jgi:nitrate/TMAO reductase-like tetraheme cytochrome c subunit
MCHSNRALTGEFEDGGSISLYVDDARYAESVHGPAGLECVACHTDIRNYPHHVQQVTCTTCHEPDGGTLTGDYVALRVRISYESRRAMTIAINESCRSCHEQEFEYAQDSAHVKAQRSGNVDAPLCVDCHGSHDITSPDRPRAKISHTCAQCHRAVYSTYRSSIHGDALEAESNPDVPTCVDCHGVHDVRGPHNVAFRNDSIETCGGCHANEEMMGRYGISTDVFNTYLDDFHGRTVDLFRRQRTGIASNKAVCFDCHGIHNIRSHEDPLSTVYPDNLQDTCQQCHQEANVRFPSAWLSHYLPTWEQTPALFLVNQGYSLLIPLTIGAFIFYILLDAGRRLVDRRKMVLQARVEEGFDDYDFT